MVGCRLLFLAREIEILDLDRFHQLADRLSLSTGEVDDALGALTAFDAVSLDGPAFARDEPDTQSRSETIGSVDARFDSSKNALGR